MKELVAFAGFEGKDEQLIKFPRGACALFLENRGHVPLLLKIGNNGRYHHQFIVFPDQIFRESLPPFTELLINIHIEDPDPPYVIVAHYIGHPYYRG